MRLKRRAFFIALCFLTFLPASVVILSWNSESGRVTQLKYDQIETGISLELAEKILRMDRAEGRDLGFVLEYDWPAEFQVTPMNFPSYVFADDNACILIWVDRDEIIVGKEYGVRRRCWMDLFEKIPGFGGRAH